MGYGETQPHPPLPAQSRLTSAAKLYLLGSHKRSLGMGIVDNSRLLVGGEALLKMDKSQDLTKVAAGASKVLNENERVRVLEAVFKPGDSAPTHHHPDHVVYVLKGGRLRVTSKGKTQEVDFKQGAVVFFDAQDHEVLNDGNTTVDLIVVELKK